MVRISQLGKFELRDRTGHTDPAGQSPLPDSYLQVRDDSFFSSEEESKDR